MGLPAASSLRALNVLLGGLSCFHQEGTRPHRTRSRTYSQVATAIVDEYVYSPGSTKLDLRIPVSLRASISASLLPVALYGVVAMGVHPFEREVSEISAPMLVFYSVCMAALMFAVGWRIARRASPRIGVLLLVATGAWFFSGFIVEVLAALIWDNEPPQFTEENLWLLIGCTLFYPVALVVALLGRYAARRLGKNGERPAASRPAPTP